MPPPITITSCMADSLFRLIRRAGGALDLSELRLGQKLAQRAPQFRVLSVLAQSREARQQLAHLTRRRNGEMADKDFRVAGGRQALFSDFKLFKELFAGPYAAENDLHIFAGPQAGK